MSFQQISFAETKIPITRGLLGVNLGQSFEEINKNFTMMEVWPKLGSQFHTAFKEHDIRIAEIKTSDLLTQPVRDKRSPEILYIDIVRLIFQNNHLRMIEVLYNDNLPYNWEGFVDDLLSSYGSAILNRTKMGDLKSSSGFSIVGYKWSDGITDLKLVHGLRKGEFFGVRITYSEIGYVKIFQKIIEKD